jgi:quinoprotein glucose dehydrogenase
LPPVRAGGRGAGRARRAAAAALFWIAALAAPLRGEPLRGEAPQKAADLLVADPAGIAIETWTSGLEVPWSLQFMPDGRALVSERPGRIRLIEPQGQLAAEPYARLDVAARGEGGLMGMALHPQFPATPYVYVMLTRGTRAGLENAVVRLRHQDNHGVFDRDILSGIPAGTYHDGGRIRFGPDGMLYVGTGDATRPELAQDLHALAGKILRVTPDGDPAPGNPFPGTLIYSYGHRNVQGLAWHPDGGELFASEHGPSGEFGLYARDKINVIRPGGNYGWPKATCAVARPPLIDPLVCWPDAAVPPGGMAFANGDLWIATLRSEALVRLRLAGSTDGYRASGIERWFALSTSQGRFGRLRDVLAGPNGSLYVLTSNRDGRGRPRAGDDRILRVTLARERLGRTGAPPERP